jgi:SnoaL-like domain
MTTDRTYDVATLADLEEIRRLKARYCRLMDQKLWSEWAELFAPDAELSIGDEDVRTLVGGAEIARFAERTLDGIKTSHNASGPDIELTGPTSARATWTAQFVQDGGRRRGFGFYEDQLEKRDGRWLFRSVELVTSWMEGSAVPKAWQVDEAGSRSK